MDSDFTSDLLQHEHWNRRGVVTEDFLSVSCIDLTNMSILVDCKSIVTNSLPTTPKLPQCMIHPFGGKRL